MSKEQVSPVETTPEEKPKEGGKKVESVMLRREAEAGVENLESFLKEQSEKDPQFREGLEKAIEGGKQREEERK